MLNKILGHNSPSSTSGKGAGLLTAWKKIALPVVAAPFSMRSVHAGCRLTLESPGSELRLIYVIEVPRSIALNAAMPVDDGMAEDSLAAAVSAAASYGVMAHTEVLHVREATDGLAKYVTQQNVDLLLLGARADGLRGLSLQVCQDLFRKVTCEVILNYIGIET